MAKNYNIYNIIYILYYIYYKYYLFCLLKHKCCLLFGCSFVRLFGFIYNSLIISLINILQKKNTMFAP